MAPSLRPSTQRVAALVALSVLVPSWSSAADVRLQNIRAASGERAVRGAFATSARYLFASNGVDVAVYDPKAPSTPIGTITNGVAGPGALAVGPTGDLYVANFGASPTNVPSITEYAPPYTGQPVRTYTYTDGIQIAPGPLAVGSDGTLYAVTATMAYPYNPTVVVYPPRSNTPARTIVLQEFYSITGLAVDASNNLYLGFVRPQQDGPSGIFKFPPGSNNGTQLPMQISGPQSLSFDSKGNLLLVAQRAVEIFAPGASQPTRVIDAGFLSPFYVALDRTEKHLYVGDAGDAGYFGTSAFYQKLFVVSYPAGQTLVTDLGVGALAGVAVDPAAPK